MLSSLIAVCLGATTIGTGDLTWAKGSGVLFLSNSMVRFDYRFPYETELEKSVTMEALLITYWILADQSQDVTV